MSVAAILTIPVAHDYGVWISLAIVVSMILGSVYYQLARGQRSDAAFSAVGGCLFLFFGLLFVLRPDYGVWIIPAILGLVLLRALYDARRGQFRRVVFCAVTGCLGLFFVFRQFDGDSLGVRWIFAALVGLLVIGTIYAWIAGRKRTEALTNVAQTLGFRFEGSKWSDSTRMPSKQMELIRHGGSFSNIMTGTFSGVETSLFDYSYSARGSQAYSQTVAAFTTEVFLPLFALRPESALSRFADIFLLSDIDFESHPVFSKRYVLCGPEEHAIRNLFTRALLSRLEELPANADWHIEGNQRKLILYRPDVTTEPEAMREFLQDAYNIACKFLQYGGTHKELSPEAEEAPHFEAVSQ